MSEDSGPASPSGTAPGDLTGTGSHLAPPDPLDPLDPLEAMAAGDGGTEYYGDIRNLAPLFAAAGAASLLIGFVPFPTHHLGEAVAAGGLFFVLTILAVTLPWARLPQWLWPVIPIGYVAVVAMLRDANSGADPGLALVYLLPIAWLAFYGKRSYLLAGLFAVSAALMVPILVVGAPDYPASEWRTVLVLILTITLVSFTLLQLVNRDRALVAKTTAQAREVERGARRAEAAHEQVASLLRAATETAIIGSDEEGTITFFSAGAEKLLGYDSAAVVAQRDIFSFFDLADLPERPASVEQLFTPGSTADGVRERRIRTALRSDGVARRLSATVTRQPGGPDGPGGFVIVASDVTEREQLVTERERLLAVQREVTQVLIEQNEQLRELTEMKADVVATVSHELRTPLTSIRGFVELLLEDGVGSLSEEQVRMLRTIDRNSLQLLRVSEDLLDDPELGRGLKVQFAETDLAAIARETIEGIAGSVSDRGLHLTLEADETVMVHGDPTRLQQLLSNVVGNAVKFAPRGGRVLVQVSTLGQFARIDVLDDGPGIPLSERHQLFERFYRLASTTEQGIPGTGLGLAIAKSVVDAHNGTIQVIDTPGWSTTFRIHLPALAFAAVDDGRGASEQ